MPLPTTLPIAAALAIAGTIAGIQLGRSAIAEIDPAHFGAPESARFFADLVPGGYRASQAEYARYNDFWADESAIPAQPDCFECGHYAEPAEFSAEADYSSVDIGAYAQAAALPPPAPAEERYLMPEEIELYASFPVTREEAELRRAPDPGETAQLNKAEQPEPYRTGGGTEEAAPIGM